MRYCWEGQDGLLGQAVAILTAIDALLCDRSVPVEDLFPLLQCFFPNDSSHTYSSQVFFLDSIAGCESTRMPRALSRIP